LLPKNEKELTLPVYARTRADGPVCAIWRVEKLRTALEKRTVAFRANKQKNSVGVKSSKKIFVDESLSSL